MANIPLFPMVNHITAAPGKSHESPPAGRCCYPAAELWTLKGAEVTRDFSFIHPALLELKARVAAWQMTWRLVTNDDGETESGVRVAFNDLVNIGGRGVQRRRRWLSLSRRSERL